MSGYLGSIGFGYPAALGAWAAVGGARPVVAVTGDGGFGQYAMELTTAVKYGIPVKHVLLNNNALGKIAKEQVAGDFAVWHTSLHNPDWAAYAELCGATGIKVTSREQLPAAMALNQVLFQTASIAGPALAGVVIVAFGVAGAYWIDVGSFLVALAAVITLTAPPREPREHPAIGRALAEGLAHFRANRILSATMLLDFFATFFGSPRALFPYYADRVFAVGPGGLGLLFAAPGIGSLVAALASGWTKRVRRQGIAVLLAVAAWGLAIVAFGLMSDGLFVPALFFIALAQGADTVSAIFRSTILLTVVPDHLRGRLVAISSMFFLGGPYLGQVESGTVASLVSPEFSVVSGGVATLVSVAGIALWAPQVTAYLAPGAEQDVASAP
jgi:predicted MFS family arabinose efflux permease